MGKIGFGIGLNRSEMRLFYTRGQINTNQCERESEAVVMLKAWRGRLASVIKFFYIRCYVVYTTFKVLHEEDLKLVKKYGENYDPLCEYTSVSLSPIVVFLVFLSLYLLGGFG